MKNKIYSLFLIGFMLQCLIMYSHMTPVFAAEETNQAAETGSSQSIVRGNVPEGFTVSYSMFMPLASDFKDIYPLFMGGTIGYLYPLDTNYSLNGSVSYVTGKSNDGDARTSITGGTIGARAGLPLWGLLYPYLGITARGSWLYEKGKNDTADFFAWDIDGLAGIAYLFGDKYGVNLECAYAFGRVTDEAVTDVSGLSFNGGIIVKVW